MSQADYKTFFDYVDTSKDGFITKNEIVKACEPDIDNDGKISTREAAIGAKTSDEWCRMIPASVMDDQKMSFVEYYGYVTAQVTPVAPPAP